MAHHQRQRHWLSLPLHRHRHLRRDSFGRCLPGKITTILVAVLVCIVVVVGVPTSSNVAQQLRYEKAPPIVFAPNGRLYRVEATARAASAVQDLSSPFCMALVIPKACRNESFAILLSTFPQSPHLYRNTAENVETETSSSSSSSTTTTTDDSIVNAINATNAINGTNSTTSPSFFEPLWIRPSNPWIHPPLAFVRPSLWMATGGPAVDSALLRQRLLQSALAWHKRHSGGIVLPMASHVHVAQLARIMADGMQASTQDMAKGNMLASSALLLGLENDNEEEKPSLQDQSLSSLFQLWRCDATGQFWKTCAAAVGRGAAQAEAALLKRVEQQYHKTNNNTATHNTTSSSSTVVLLPRDAQAFLSTLTPPQALQLALDCLFEALQQDTNKRDSPAATTTTKIPWQAVVIQSPKLSSLLHLPEMSLWVGETRDAPTTTTNATL